MRRFIGDRKFYVMVLAVAVPVMLQNGITSIVGLLDNVMVGRVGTEQMAGVAIANQLIFVFQLLVFGGVAGAGIFMSQFFGMGDTKGQRYTFRFKIYLCILIVLVSVPVLFCLDEPLIKLFLHSSGGGGDAVLTLNYAKKYLRILLIELLPFALTQAYSSSLRETKETVLPMKAGLGAVCVNLALNYVLIFGKLGAPVLGVEGAAIATVIARFVELAIVAVWTHRHAEKKPFIRCAYKSPRIPASLFKSMIKTGAPLLVNEGIWSVGMTVIAQCYSLRGIYAVAAYNIANTLMQVSLLCCLALGSAITIIVGGQLGAGKAEEAKDSDNKLIAFTVATGVAIGIIIITVAPFFPKLYNTAENVRLTAQRLIMINGAILPMISYTNAAYFSLRCGGRTLITFLFDGAFMLLINAPAAFLLARFTQWDIVILYAAVQSIEVLKGAIGYGFLRSGGWARTIVQRQE